MTSTVECGLVTLHVVVEQGHYVVALELVAAVKEIEFDDEGEACDLSAERAREFGGGFGGASGGEQVVDNENFFAGADGVLVHFERVGAVFQCVIEFDSFGGELADFADGNESGVEAVGERGGEDEAAGLHAEDEID